MQRKKQTAFSLKKVDREEILKDILNLGVSKVFQDNDISSKLFRRTQTSLSAFYTLVLIRPLLIRNFHQY